MTDISKYKNVSLTKVTYQNLYKIRRVITPHIVQSRSGTINILVNKEMERLNGKAKDKAAGFYIDQKLIRHGKIEDMNLNELYDKMKTIK